MAVVLTFAFAWAARARADTMVDGGNLGGQVWTAEGSPYVVTEASGPPVVPEGTELRIEAGVTVLLAGARTLALEVLGSLKVRGTPDAPVVMRGAFNDNDVLWQGIVAQDGGSPSVEITNAEFRDARYAVMLRDGQANISRATFENCVFGLSLSSNDRDYAFDSLVFRNNAVGFECDFCGHVQLTNVVAVGNWNHALVLHGAGAISVANATIDGAGRGHGLDIWPSPAHAGDTSAVELVNTIFSNNTVAIELDLLDHATLKTTHSTFWNNSAAHLRIK
jgi:hypothetical protein